MNGRLWRLCGVLMAAAAVLPACKGKEGGSAQVGTVPSASGSAGTSASAAATGSVAKGSVVAIPIEPDKVAKVVNPKNETPYSGPVGTLRGVVRIKGDPPPDTGLTFPAGCGEGAATYGKLFRTGQDGAVADAMVAVTGYQGYVPAGAEAEKLTIHGCAFARRTMAVAFGQRIEVSNLDKMESYMPYLDGAPFRAVMVAMPGGDSVKFYPQEPGHYMLRDQLPKPFMTVDVYVVAYATHDVTGLDGQYEIKGIPVGKVRANAFLPAINKATESFVEIKPGDNTLDLVLEYKKPEPEKAGAEAEKKPGKAAEKDIGPKG